MLLAACGGPRPRPWGSLIVAPGQPIPLALAAATADARNLALTAGRVAAAAGPIDGHALSVTALPVGCAAADPMSAAVDTRALRNSAGVIGPMCSTACVYSEGALYAKRLTMITPSCTAAAVVQQGFPIAFRLAWDDNDQAVLSARYARAGLHAGRAAVVGDKTIYCVALTTVFKDVFRGAGGSVVAASSLSAAGGDLGGLARAIRSAHADVVFVAVGGSEAGA
ncbi:MAG TPA: ABC transporter substrate-binding protein, partial [Steroidobacteraceae bacterium]|nr:ABC transporter substrate-binding protein [Steroidobacteraceae bacterium]